MNERRLSSWLPFMIRKKHSFASMAYVTLTITLTTAKGVMVKLFFIVPSLENTLVSIYYLFNFMLIYIFILCISYVETYIQCLLKDLAYQIAHKYEGLLNSFNESGYTPLHLLASKPAAFESGCHLGWFNKIVYYCKTHSITITQLSSP